MSSTPSEVVRKCDDAESTSTRGATVYSRAVRVGGRVGEFTFGMPTCCLRFAEEERKKGIVQAKKESVRDDRDGNAK